MLVQWLLSALLLALAPAPAESPPVQIIPVPPNGTPAPAPTPQPAPIPTSVRVAGERFELLMLTGHGTQPVTWDITSPTAFVSPVVLFELKPGTTTDGWRMGATAPAVYQVGDAPTVKVYATGDGAATLAAWGVANGRPVKLATFQVIANRGPQPPPPDVDPIIPDPVVPAKTFRVFFIYESGDMLTNAQRSVMFGVEVENYLNATCTGGKAGWRRRDKDSPGEQDRGMAALWAAIKPALTTVPAVAVEKNGTVEIIPPAPTPAAMIATFQQYVEGRK